MATKSDSYACSTCGHSSSKWFGRCPGCGEWSTATDVQATSVPSAGVVTLGASGPPPARVSSGDRQIDEVLGGGFVVGQVALVAGEPGIGKSTLVLQMLDGITRGGLNPLLVAGEESTHQISLRSRRLGLDLGSLRVAPTTSLASIVAACEKNQPDVVVVDSIQTLKDDRLDQAPGSPTQVRECAAALVAHAKRSGCIVVLVGHVTKDGSVAGPKTLEHVVDGVFVLEGERSGTLRMFRSLKNRFGSCDELGIFLMSEHGLAPVPDPSAMLMADRLIDAPGSVVFPSLEGARALLVEIQGLASDDKTPTHPRLVTLGVDARRAALAPAVLGKSAGVDLGASDLFVAAAGGLSVTEPAADLAICLALASSRFGVAVDPGLVAVGEVGLGGEVRGVPGLDRRLKEARRMGFRRAVVPGGQEARCDGLQVVAARDVNSALRTMRTAA